MRAFRTFGRAVRSFSTGKGLKRCDLQDRIVALCRRRGFVFPGSEIYGGLSGSFDYGPLGAQLKRNIAQAWWNEFIVAQPDCMGLDTAVVSHPSVWESAGHLDRFCDVLAECKQCKTQHRADHLLDHTPTEQDEQKRLEEIRVAVHEVACPRCGNRATFDKVENFNLLFETTHGTTRSFLRPETAQGIFVNFPRLAERKKLPFGVGQIGQAFRNEVKSIHSSPGNSHEFVQIAPRNFLFRTREFEQAELEFFCAPDDADAWFDHWVTFCRTWLRRLGLKEDSLRLNTHGPADLAHYARACVDIEFHYPFGWGELWGIANRGDFDLRTHHAAVGGKPSFRVGDTNTFPFVIEPSLGLDRLIYALLVDAYSEETVAETNETRTVLKLQPCLAPFRCAVLPLHKKGPMVDFAHALHLSLATGSRFRSDMTRETSAPLVGTSMTLVDFDQAGSIGKRYRRCDEIGTPYCVTVDHQSLEDATVTVRDRDTKGQVRVTAEELCSPGFENPFDQ